MAIVSEPSGFLEKVSPALRRAEQWLRQQIFSTDFQQQSQIIRCVTRYHKGKLLVLFKNDSVLSQHTFSFPEFNESYIEPLRKWVNEHRLTTLPMTFILSHEDYQLFLMDSITLEQGEQREALKWHVKALLHQPSEEIVIDYFELPGTKTGKNVMYDVVVSKEKRIRALKHFFKFARVLVDHITIPELGLKMLTSLLEEDLKSTALFYLDDASIVFNISREKQLYLTKRMPIANGFEAVGDEFFLEIQRYFDYFQNQWRHSKPSRIVYLSPDHNAAKNTFIQRMEQQLGLTVSPFPIDLLVRQSGYVMENETLDPLLFSELIKESIHVETTN